MKRSMRMRLSMRLWVIELLDSMDEIVIIPVCLDEMFTFRLAGARSSCKLTSDDGLRGEKRERMRMQTKCQ